MPRALRRSSLFSAFTAVRAPHVRRTIGTMTTIGAISVFSAVACEPDGTPLGGAASRTTNGGGASAVGSVGGGAGSSASGNGGGSSGGTNAGAAGSNDRGWGFAWPDGGAGGNNAAGNGGGGAPTTSGGAAGKPNAGPMRTVYVAGGLDDRRVVSFDGKTVASDVYSAPIANVDHSITGIAVGNATIVAAGGSGVFTSKNGKDWIVPTPARGDTWSSLRGACAIYADNRFVVTNGSDAASSPDGVVWSLATTLPNLGTCRDIAWGNGHYVALGEGSVRRSVDGFEWTDYQKSDALDFRAIHFAQGRFLAVGAAGHIATSTDGVTWTDQPAIDGAPALGGIAFGLGTYLLVGGGARTSPDGVTWTKTQMYSADNRLAFSGKEFVVSSWRTQMRFGDAKGAFTLAVDPAGPNKYDETKESPYFVSIGVGEIAAE